MVCVHVPCLLKRNVGVLFGDLRGPRSDAPFFILLWVCIIVIQLIIQNVGNLHGKRGLLSNCYANVMVV